MLSFKLVVFILFGALYFSPSVMAGDEIRFDCPASVSVDQKSSDSKAGFSLNKTEGIHVLLSGRLAAYKEPYPEHKGKASLVYKSTGVMSDENLEKNDTKIEKFTNDGDWLVNNSYQFFCEYQDTSITFSAPVPRGFNECSLVTEMADPAKSTLTQVYMICKK